MPIHTSISHFTGKEQNNLHHITKRIVENIAPENIFCYGSRLIHEINRSCFTHRRKSESYSCMYDLVIIISDGEKLGEDAVRQFAENIANKFARANILVHRKGFVSNEMQEGNFFFSWLYRSAILLYSKEKWPNVILPILPKKDSVMFPESFSRMKQLLNDAQSFLSTAREHRKEKAYSMALYMAKQSIESSCMALLFGCAGHSWGLKDMAKLLNQTQNLTMEVIAFFPQNTREEKRLLSLLLAATGTAYTNELNNPTSIEVLILIDRVQQVKQIVETLIQQKIGVLKIPNNTFLTDNSNANEKRES